MNDGSTSTSVQSAARLSGRAVVVAMFVFGIALTALLWIYWTLHTGPFRPLQDALAAEIPGSSPRVEGGQHKIHKGTPRILRVTLRVDFDPVQETRRGEELLNRVEEIARKHIEMRAYDRLQVFLFEGVPEEGLRQNEFVRDLGPRR